MSPTTEDAGDRMTPVSQPLHAAIDDYLDWAVVHAFKPGSGTPRTYRIKLGMYARTFGETTPVKDVTGQDWYKACNAFWADASAETYNSGRRAALSFLSYCLDCEPPLTDAKPPKLWKPRKVPRDRSRALPETTVKDLFDPCKYPLRERALWALLYDSSERLSAVLSLNIEGMDLVNRIAVVRIKGADTRYISWSPAASVLLSDYIGERTQGPVFLGEVQPWNWRDRPAEDRGPGGLLYRLTAHRARIVFREATGVARPHRLRHSRLTHLGGRQDVNSAMLKAISGHLTDKQLGEYSRPGPDVVADLMAKIGSLMED